MSPARKPATAAVPGWQPLMIADVPPLVEKVGGPSWWKVGVGSNGAGAGGPIIPPGSMATLFVGATDAAAGPFYLTGPMAVAMLATTPQGFATAQVPIVLNAAMIGIPAYLQWVVVDPAGWVGYSESAWFVPL